VRVHLIHGIRTEPISPVENLIPYLVAAGFAVAYPDYGYLLELETAIVNPMLVGAIYPYIGKGDVLIGHSNGAAIAYELMNRGSPVAGLVLINGALQSRLTRAVGTQWIDVYYNAVDQITVAAAAAQRLGIVDPNWGELGHSGYWGTDPAIKNFNCGGTVGMPIVQGHSDFFTPEKLKSWGPYLAKRIRTVTPP
jgi:pimeloyl-ACP methyl ester carboxylesterase